MSSISSRCFNLLDESENLESWFDLCELVQQKVVPAYKFINTSCDRKKVAHGDTTIFHRDVDGKDRNGNEIRKRGTLSSRKEEDR